MKRVTAALLVLLVALVLATPVLGAEQPGYYVFDEAGLFDEKGMAEVYKKAEEVSSTLGIDVIVLTTDVDHGYSAQGFADAFFDEMNYGSGPKRDGIVLYIDMYNRELVSLTNGYADDWLRPYNQKITDSGTSKATGGDYTAAMVTMLDKALDYGLRGNNYAGLSFGQKLAYKLTPQLLLRSLGIGAIVAVIVVGILLAMHYTASPKAPHAAAYFAPGGPRTTHAADYFIHTHTTRTAIPKDNGSSGGSRGGGGGGGGRSSASSKF